MTDAPSFETGPRWLSILVPVFKAERYLEACVRSVLAQVDDGVEILLLDDASPDGSAGIATALCREHPARIRLIRHAANAGLSAARNSLLAHARGEYVWHLDADDLMLPGAIEGLRRVVADACPDLVLCDYSVLRERAWLKHRLRGERHRASFEGASAAVCSDRSRLVAGLMRKRCLQAWSKIARRSVWQAAPFPEDRRLMQDVAVVPALVAATRTFVHVRQPWVGYRRHDDSAWTAPAQAWLSGALLSLQDLKRGMANLPDLDDEARFAVDYYCLRTLARLSDRMAKRSARDAEGRTVVDRAYSVLFPGGMVPTIAGCRMRGWHLRAWRLRSAMRARAGD